MGHLKGYEITNSKKVCTYKKFETEFNLNFDGLEFLIKLTDVSKFKSQNDSSINLYFLQHVDQKYKVFPIYLTENKKSKERHIHLLVLE